MPYFYYFFGDKIFVTVGIKAGIFTKHIWQPYVQMKQISKV